MVLGSKNRTGTGPEELDSISEELELGSQFYLCVEPKPKYMSLEKKVSHWVWSRLMRTKLELELITKVKNSVTLGKTRKFNSDMCHEHDKSCGMLLPLEKPCSVVVA